MKTILTFKKQLLIIGVLLSLFCMAYGQYQPPPQTGDYRNTENVALVSAVVSENKVKWEMYDGANWVTAPHPLTYYQPAFTGNIYAVRNMVVDADFTMAGNIYSPNAATFVHVATGATFTLSPNSTYELRQMVVSKLARFINYGNVESAEPTSEITLDSGEGLGEGGKLENHGSIEIEGLLDVKDFAWVISKAGATIHGPGSIDTNIGGSRIVIANTGGYDEAIALTGTHNVQRACFNFNGAGNQVTGLNFPDQVFSIDFEGGNKVTLSKPVEMWAYGDDIRGNPYIHVKNNTTLDLGSHSITSSAAWGNTSFFLDAGSGIATAHPNGISSVKSGNLIGSGAIQTNNATYSSGANYIFSGTPGQRQYSGAFVTSNPDSEGKYHVNNIINLSDDMLLLDNGNFRPLRVDGGYQGNINTDSGIGEGYVEGQTLPVTLSYFNGYFNGFDSVVLQWETQTETNNLGFYVLRATELEPASAGVISDLIQAANTSQGATYYFEDKDLYEDGIYYYWLQDVSFSGLADLHGPILVQVTLGAGSNHVPDLPLTTSLVRNYPNPFNPSTQLEYYLEEGSDVAFEVYNLKGQKLDQFTLRHQDKGFHRYTWEPQLGSGIYLIKFTADGKSNIRKVVLTK